MSAAEPDLFGDLAGTAPMPTLAAARRPAARREEIRAAIDDLRGDAPILSVGIGRLARVVGGSKAHLQHERDAYAAEHGEPSVVAPAIPPADPGQLLELDADLLAQHPINPRLADGDPHLDDLADAIATDGQLVPVCIIADATAPGRFLILDGSRRHRAIQRLRERGLDRPVRATLVPTADAMDFLVAHVATSASWSDYERAVFFVAAWARGGTSQALLARRAGLTAGGFNKAMAPARLPNEILALIANRRAIRVLDAHRALMRWKADEPAVRAALLTIAAPASARAVLGCAAAAGLPGPSVAEPTGATMLVPLRDRARALIARLDAAPSPTPEDITALSALVRALAAI
ncbi:MAG: ParB N-terminal domain-containing protein [Sphingomonas adhaesiva]|uniref:ParB/RepB/Spo0J family partition protein n=1 Tax=Sphingomonas adhaesiva TaxID=28212 RepID=UPI002FF95E00